MKEKTRFWRKQYYTVDVSYFRNNGLKVKKTINDDLLITNMQLFAL